MALSVSGKSGKKSVEKFTIRDIYLPNLLTIFIYLRHLEQKYAGQFAFFRPGINPYGLTHFNHIHLLGLLEKYLALVFTIGDKDQLGLEIVQNIFESMQKFITTSATSGIKFSAIPLIYMNNGRDLHINIMIFDNIRRQAELFEPNGIIPILHGNTKNNIIITYKWLNTWCNKLGYEFFAPSDYMGTYGIQIIDANLNKTDRDFRDPEGFCTVWSLVWTEMHILYPDINREKLYEILIDKMIAVNIRTFLRVYADKILEIVMRKVTEISSHIANDIISAEGDSAIKYFAGDININLIYPMVLFLSSVPINNSKIRVQWDSLPTKYLFSMVFKFTEYLNYI